MADTFKGIITADGKKRQLPYGAVLEKPVSDKTLSEEGGFADAKAVGDKFSKVDSETASLKEDFGNKIPFAVNNIFTLDGATRGEYVRSDGSIHSNEELAHTGYLDLTSYEGELTMSLLSDPTGHFDTYVGAFYDANKRYISGYTKSPITSDIEFVIDIPDGACYLIFNYLLNSQDRYYIKATTKNSILYDAVKDLIPIVPISQHFYSPGKEPFIDTVNRQITFHAGCPFVVNGKSYGGRLGSDVVVNMPTGNADYYNLYLDLLNSSVYSLSFTWSEANANKPQPHMAYVGQVNIRHMWFGFHCNINIDGTLYYALGADVISNMIDCEYRTYSGGYVQKSNGKVKENARTGYTSYIDVSYFSKIYSPIDITETYEMAFYDANKTYISGAYDSTKQIKVWEIPVPASAKYARMSFYLDVESTFYVKGALKNLKAFVEGVVASSSNYSQMKMNCLGDSITYGYIPDNGAQMKKPYPAILKDILPLAECRNYGISGSTLAVNSGNYDPMCIRYADMDNDADIVLVFGGTNDYGRAVYTPTLGTITDNVNTTVYGALNILCEGLVTKYPKAFIFLCTPLKRADKTGANDGGYTLEDVANAIREVGQKFGMPVLDLNYKGGFYISNSSFRGQYGGNDKLHPNQAFNEEHLAPMIAKFIKSNL